MKKLILIVTALMLTILAVADSGKTIYQMDTTQINTLKDVAAAKVKVSSNADFILKQVKAIPYDHPIRKDGDKRMIHKTNPQVKDANIATMTVYPNPFSEYTNVTYYIPDQQHNYSIALYNNIGQIIKKYPIMNEGNGQLTIDGNLLNSGIYSCHLIMDDKIMYSAKLVIIK